MRPERKKIVIVKEVVDGYRATLWEANQPTMEYIQSNCIFKLRDILTNQGFSKIGFIGTGKEKLETWG